MKPDPQLTDSIEPSPEKLLAPFAKGRITMWIVVAVILHVLLIGGTSLGFIRDKWIDPEGAAIRKAQAQAAADALKAKAKPAPVKSLAVATNVTTTTAAIPANTVPPAPVNDPNSDANRNKTPTAARINSTAPTNEIPKAPDDLGLNLRDTAVK